jgi:hypothetical protein
MVLEEFDGPPQYLSCPLVIVKYVEAMAAACVDHEI